MEGATRNFNLEEMHQDILKHLSKNVRMNIDDIEGLFMSYSGTDADKRTAVDQAFRDVLKSSLSQPCTGLTSQEDDMKTFQDLIDFVVQSTKKRICTNNLPILLLSDIFDTITLDKCEKMFDYVERNVNIWTSEPFFSNGKHHLLRMCNDILRRLSKSQNTIFCGRIQLFLAQLFPIEEKSALNLMSTFHADNITVYKRNPSEFADDIIADNMEAEDGELTVNPVDYTLYVKFWSIQEYFRIPTQCYSNSAWRAFKTNINEVLKVFESHKIEHNVRRKKEVQQAEVSLSEIMKNCLDTQNYFAKYLTNEKLLNLQLNDSMFRRYFLVQILIIFQYLTGKVKFKTELQALNDSQTTWIKETTDRVYSVLSEMPPNGSKFSKTVRHILKREENWINWKNEGCLSFAKSDAKPSQEKLKENARKGKKRNIGDDFLNPANKRIYMGNNELTRLWNLCPDNLEACKADSRLKFLPKLEDFFDEAIEQADPEAGIEEEYKLVKQSHFQWRALRLLARRSHHFFTPSNQPFKALPDYLTSVIDALSKELKPVETKMEVKLEPTETPVKSV